MEQRIDTLVAELYTGHVCAQRHYLRHTLLFLSRNPSYLHGTAADLCVAMRGTFSSFRGKPVRHYHIYEVLRLCDRDLTARGVVPGGTMEMLRILMAQIR